MSNTEERVSDDAVLEPLTAYKTQYEGAFRRNCEAYFDGLVKKSGIDLAENRRTVKAYTEQSRLAEETGRRVSRYKGFSAALIVLIVVAALLTAVAVLLLVEDVVVAGAVLCALGPVLIVVAAVVLAKVVRPRIKSGETEFKARQEKANELLRRAWGQTSKLNDLFENNVTKGLIEKTVPLLRLDDYFNVRRYDYLNGKYGYGSGGDASSSTIGLLSGEISGNPFVEERMLVHTMGSYTYTGSIVIHWTTYGTDSKGHPVTHHHSETLTASVTRPKPYYSRETRLVYGNDAAPDLHFSRRPAHAEDLGERELASRVKRGAKDIRKKQERAMKEGGSFTGMGNEEFDALFGAMDRDNDVQFRLLFTPLAQKNMLALIKDAEGFGDDFYMRKSGCLNYVISEHSARWEMEEARERYYSYSADLSRKLFLEFNEQYFRSLYFDLAPLLSIPLYQQYKPREYIYRELYPRNFTEQESEYAVNRMESSAFAPPSAATPSILKTRFLEKEGGSDRVCVTASAYAAEPRTEFVSVFGGDGCFHEVPVEWTEYIPVRSDTVVAMKELGLPDAEFYAEANSGSLRGAMEKYGGRAFGYNHGILCCIVPGDSNGFDADFNIKKKD